MNPNTNFSFNPDFNNSIYISNKAPSSKENKTQDKQSFDQEHSPIRNSISNLVIPVFNASASEKNNHSNDNSVDLKRKLDSSDDNEKIKKKRKIKEGKQKKEDLPTYHTKKQEAINSWKKDLESFAITYNGIKDLCSHYSDILPKTLTPPPPSIDINNNNNNNNNKKYTPINTTSQQQYLKDIISWALKEVASLKSTSQASSNHNILSSKDNSINSQKIAMSEFKIASHIINIDGPNLIDLQMKNKDGIFQKIECLDLLKFTYDYGYTNVALQILCTIAPLNDNEIIIPLNAKLSECKTLLIEKMKLDPSLSEEDEIKNRVKSQFDRIVKYLHQSLDNSKSISFNINWA